MCYLPRKSQNSRIIIGDQNSGYAFLKARRKYIYDTSQIQVIPKSKIYSLTDSRVINEF